MQAKRKIKICYIVAIIIAIVNLFMFVLDFDEDVAMFWKVMDLVYVISSLIALTGFAIFNFKPLDFAIKHKKAFVVLVCFSCVSSLILGYIALLAIFDLNHANAKKQSDNSIEITGEVLPTYDEIVNKIKALDELKQQNLITEEEYNKRKQEILDMIIKK